MKAESNNDRVTGVRICESFRNSIMDAPPEKKQCIDNILENDDNKDDNNDDPNEAEQKRENAKEAAEDNDELDPLNCRLRCLNVDCLLSIFEYLSVKDLLHVCELDDYFKDIITEHVVPTKLVDFTKTGGHWTTNKIFQTFGKKMRRIKIVEENTLHRFQYFLILIIEYCTPDRLIELQLRYHSTAVDPTVLRQALPYFTKLKKLVLMCHDERSAYDSFVTSLCSASVSLKTLNLLGVTLFPGWSEAESMNNLEELRLHVRGPHSTLGTRAADLPDFVRTKHQLKLFSYIGHENISNVTRVLSQHCRQLETYNDFNLRSQPDDLRALMDTHDRYKYIADLPNIKHLSITSYAQYGDDIHYALMKLAGRTSLESLNILINSNASSSLNRSEMQVASEKWLSQLSQQSFQNLTTVGLRIVSDTKEIFEFDCTFICKFLQRVSSISKITVCVDGNIRNVYKILEYAPQLRIFAFSKTRMRHLPVEMRKMHRIIKKMHEQRKDLPPIHLVTNIQQHRELQVCIQCNHILCCVVMHFFLLFICFVIP